MVKQTEFDFDKVLESFKPFDDLLNKYFNTTSLSGAKLKEAKIKAGSQNALILELFRAYPGISLSPTEVEGHLAYKLRHAPLTSIRRALTTLTDLGYLVKTSEQRMGRYGAKEGCWRLK
jgi:Fe2+ or Zn2+ uptake regulation protein